MGFACVLSVGDSVRWVDLKGTRKQTLKTHIENALHCDKPNGLLHIENANIKDATVCIDPLIDSDTLRYPARGIMGFTARPRAMMAVAQSA
jgi:hypothetical protein